MHEDALPRLKATVFEQSLPRVGARITGSMKNAPSPSRAGRLMRSGDLDGWPS
jgi:hypothetical protein